MSIELITLLLFGSLIVGLLTGLPISFVLGGVGVVFTYLLWGFAGLAAVPLKVTAMAGNFAWVALPLFIFMGSMLQKSGVAEDMYKTFHFWMGPLRGSLAVGTVFTCTIFAAMSGISGAATVAMGLIALPEMLKRSYDKGIAVGSIAAGGALGILIPPSVTMIMLGLFANLSIGKLFVGGVFPGLLLSSLFITYILIRCAFQRHLGPTLPPEERVGWIEKLASLRMLILPIVIVVMVLGSIFLGVTSISEAAAMGALGSLISAAVYHRLNWQSFRASCEQAFGLTAMIMWIFFGGLAFVTLYTAVGAVDLVAGLVSAVPGGRWGILVVIQLILILLGMFIDPGGIILITTPVFLPIITALGFDPIWFGVLFVINMEMGYLTPPFGLNLFYMRSVAPKEISMGDIYRAIIPFVLLQLLGLIICMVFPQIVLWLPNLVFGGAV